MLLALWATLVVAGSAVAGEPGCCGPLCCDEPCPTTTDPGPCDCCALSAPLTDDPGLVPAPLAAPAPSTTANLAPPTVLAGGAPLHTPFVVALTPDPLPCRPSVLRI
jgi:hypothetical protein